MPTVPYANVLRVVCHQTVLSDESVNVWHVLIPAGTILAPGDTQALADAFSLFYAGSITGTPGSRGIGNTRPIPAILDQINVYDLRTVPNPAVEEFPYAIAGTAAADNVPWDSAVVASLRTATGGRSGRGRVYLGPTAGLYSASTPTTAPGIAAAQCTSIANTVADLNARINAIPTLAGTQLAVLSVTDGLARFVTRVVVDGRPDTQRRRDLSLPFATASVNL